MKAVVASDYGPPEGFTLADVETPLPGPGQIQVKVRAAALNPVDLTVVAGGLAELTFPHVLGNDFAGTVTAIGPGVTGFQQGGFKPGDEVFGHAMPRALRAIAGRGKPSLGTGTLAEFVVVEADTPFIAHRPPSLPAAEAAALGTAGLTARAVAITAAVTPGERVLVIGATGGVGTTLLPLLSHAHAIATGHPADETLLRKLGATETMGYAQYPPNIDVALNLALPSDQLADVARVIRPGGRLFTITFPFPRQEWIARDDVEFRLILDSEGTLGGAAELTELRATIAHTYALAEGPEAYRDLAHRHSVGKLVIAMP
ncbi:NADPH:quinone reductase-like Zn-dependent oxidoreductase [Actinoplanes lutulentus]|uniref:NADPH:quinone reductase-like Zn-dependent oxidoreductase n=1 Tax=Actinoplanes lutulentus TaxID=1287878 RepID=A0A327Z9S6_9ACTN|nr:NADP-dependent oxidoreductase [Actinoplanes lutulentus]MBB2943195.1 NADPH:quinone reductase-like Zn-dependent oxidoreductase [Actinoplanes lutulentus]RAK28261.1 NADPH:quinone reductase-like Zn-dependent oxidoreductase [Actinoplanes lutulentus]